MSSREAEWAALLRSAMAGDASAYRRFLEQIAPFVRAVAHSRCRGSGTEGEIEDVVQEVLLTIHLKRGTWDQSRPVGPWVATIARHKLIDFLRRRGRHVSLPMDDVVDTLFAEKDTRGHFAAEVDGMLGQSSRNRWK